MAVATMKSSVIEFQMAPFIKSLAEKYLFQMEKQREREIMRGERQEKGRRGEQRGEGVDKEALLCRVRNSFSRAWLKR